MQKFSLCIISLPLRISRVLSCPPFQALAAVLCSEQCSLTSLDISCNLLGGKSSGEAFGQVCLHFCSLSFVSLFLIRSWFSYVDYKLLHLIFDYKLSNSIFDCKLSYFDHGGGRTKKLLFEMYACLALICSLCRNLLSPLGRLTILILCWWLQASVRRRLENGSWMCVHAIVRSAECVCACYCEIVGSWICEQNQEFPARLERIRCNVLSSKKSCTIQGNRSKQETHTRRR